MGYSIYSCFTSLDLYWCCRNSGCPVPKLINLCNKEKKGYNIPDIEEVVEWKIPVSVSTFGHGAGSGVHDPEQTGFAVPLIKESVYEANLTRLNEPSSGDKKKCSPVLNIPKSTMGLCESGVQLGLFIGLHNKNLLKDDILLNIKLLNEGS